MSWEQDGGEVRQKIRAGSGNGSGKGPAGSFGTAHKGEVPVTLSISGASPCGRNALLGASSVTIFQDPVTRFDPFVPTTVERTFQN
ncbi:hypothetical protein GCM10011609_19610 [Lentzea pudingi]|uniref:Uncharacterized protein n=1 Tax=Lentzea pudingi TaxID=1789439 RepID=A0ABQ2HKI1_9PSEU|nr:hypothetical protein GCM10011609_19610 [Lentzea pudingi]